MPQKTDAVIAELMDRRLLNDVDPDLHQEIAKAVVKAVHTASLQGEDAVERVALAFHPGEQAPDVKRGSMECCIVVTENEQGKHFAFPGYYLNAYPLQYDECRCDEPCEDGCPTTGWFYDESNFEYENCYYPISSKILRWALIPDAECILATGLVADEAAIRANSTANLISIIADIREKTGVGGKPMLNELADAIVAEMDRRAADEREKCARIVERWSLPTIQAPSMWLIDKAGIAAAIRSGGGSNV